MEHKRFELAMSPHVGTHQNTRKIMFDVIIALLPALAAATWFFGPGALLLVALSVATAVLAEYLCLKFMKRPVSFAFDGSAIVTGILLAYNVPPGVPWWLPVLGSAFAIVVAKQAFGGLGHNIVNPALLGRAFLMASFPILMTAGWTAPEEWRNEQNNPWETNGIVQEELLEMPNADAISGATPLNVLKQSFDLDKSADLANEEGNHAEAVELEARASSIRHALSQKSTYLNLLVGRRGGCIGETSVLLLLAGALFLIIRGVLEIRLPLSYLGTVALFAWVFGGSGWFNGDPLFHVLAGGVILGGFFMVSDMVTTPVTPKGRIIFGVGAGLLTMVIRRWGGYPEGCSYSILLMNLVTPLIDRFTRPKIFGEVKEND
ncbi:MAG: RnfABCDGE type electron transport complex subunit D [Candidatus Aegiribacteria sp.]|nr:RnfABCDGE type electron transport complex subunit D [Candidatus Aegiribacteria sp.]